MRADQFHTSFAKLPFLWEVQNQFAAIKVAVNCFYREVAVFRYFYKSSPVVVYFLFVNDPREEEAYLVVRYPTVWWTFYLQTSKWAEFKSTSSQQSSSGSSVCFPVSQKELREGDGLLRTGNYSPVSKGMPLRRETVSLIDFSRLFTFTRTH